jgi:hypothetical protein
MDLPAPVVDGTDPDLRKDEQTNLPAQNTSTASDSVGAMTQADGHPNWLSSILLFNREEPVEVAELRKRVEEEEIKRYMTNFQKVSPATGFLPQGYMVTESFTYLILLSMSITFDFLLNKVNHLNPDRDLIPLLRIIDAKSPSPL